MLQSTLSDLQKAITSYQETFRNPALSEFRLSTLYDLFPPCDADSDDLRWPNPWPGNDSAGVYFVLDEELNIVYIGKASMNSSIGIRLSSYFVYGENRKCRIRHPNSWVGEPRFIATIAMKDHLRFEASALEEYLIANLRTTDNRAGRTRDDV